MRAPAMQRRSSVASMGKSSFVWRLIEAGIGAIIFVLTGSKQIERLLRSDVQDDPTDESAALRAQDRLEARIRSLMFAISESGTRLERLVLVGTDARELAAAVIEAEGMRPERSGFSALILPRLIATCDSICCVNDALSHARSRADTAFQGDDATHVAMLTDLWRELRPTRPGPGETLSSYKSAAWGDLGFQGQDPGTDFRGMGLLGLSQLLHYAKAHTGPARAALDRLDLPRVGYPLAIVSIAMSDWTLTLLKTRKLDAHFGGSTTWPRNIKSKTGKGRDGYGGASEATPLLGGDGASFTPRPSPAPSTSNALSTYYDIHACLLLLLDCVWWEGGQLSVWIPSTRAELDRNECNSANHGFDSIHCGNQRGVVFALARAALERRSAGGSDAGSVTAQSSGSTSASGLGQRNPVPLSVMDFPRVFKDYKAAVELLLDDE